MHTPAMVKSVAGKYQLYRCTLRPAFAVIIIISLYIVYTLPPTNAIRFNQGFCSSSGNDCSTYGLIIED